MAKKIKEENANIFNNKEELYLNEYNWEISKDVNEYSFKIRLNTNNTILFSCLILNLNKEKIYFDYNFTLKDLHYYDRFKNNENINDIYIYLLTMIQDNQFEFEQKEDNQLILNIKPYTNSEKLIAFVLDKKPTNINKYEICGGMRGGLNCLRCARNNERNVVSSSGDVSYNVNCDCGEVKALIVPFLSFGVLLGLREEWLRFGKSVFDSGFS